MFAAIEYLLSHMPVVTTSSIGGRDVFSSDDCALAVAAEQAAVAAGVKEMVARAPRPERHPSADPGADGGTQAPVGGPHRADRAGHGVRLDAAIVQAIYKLRPMHGVVRFT
jgi:hypothetical protein